jgi:IstB-like ATP binding protein
VVEVGVGSFDFIALDDIGYVQHDRAEMEVLFALLAERHERKSVMITNLVFSKWDQIFKDPMTTAAAIDRVVHHAVVLEFLGRSECEKVVAELVYVFEIAYGSGWSAGQRELAHKLLTLIGDRKSVTAQELIGLVSSFR